MDANAITQAIIAGNWTNDDLGKFINAIQFCRNCLTKQNVGKMVIGTHVQFNAKSRGGKTITGEVVKVGRKFITIREHGTNFGGWRVPANMLSVV
jgi:hypothetical protein